MAAIVGGQLIGVGEDGLLTGRERASDLHRIVAEGSGRL